MANIKDNVIIRCGPTLWDRNTDLRSHPEKKKLSHCYINRRAARDKPLVNLYQAHLTARDNLYLFFGCRYSFYLLEITFDDYKSAGCGDKFNTVDL